MSDEFARALAVNLMRDPRKGKAVSPNDFNPFAEKPQKIVLKGAEMLGKTAENRVWYAEQNSAELAE